MYLTSSFFSLAEMEIFTPRELPSTFDTDIQRLYNNPRFSDVHFIVENTQFYAHKVILFALCPDLLNVHSAAYHFFLSIFL
jgi:hypothetical protein